MALETEQFGSKILETFLPLELRQSPLGPDDMRGLNRDLLIWVVDTGSLRVRNQGVGMKFQLVALE